MVPEIIGGLGAINSLFDMAKGLKDINDATVRSRAVVELLEKIVSAQSAQSALIERVRHLEKEVTRFETWEAEKERYELVSLHDGSLAYVVKEAVRGTEPVHYLCASCYQNGKKSIMQGMTSVYQGHLLSCPICKLQIVKGFYYDS